MGREEGRSIRWNPGRSLGLLVLQGNQGAVVDAAREVPRFRSRRPEVVCKDVPSHVGHLSHRVQPQAVHLGLYG